MEYDKIKQLMDDMSNSGLTSLNIDFPDGTKVSMKKEQTKVISNQEDNSMAVSEVLPATEKEKVADKKEDTKCNVVKSPMVGTFYIKPSPTEKPYVEVGTKVKKGDTLCIIEAMKLMNEIESDFSGEIKEVLVQDGEPVEYGTELFIISNE